MEICVEKRVQLKQLLDRQNYTVVAAVAELRPVPVCTEGDDPGKPVVTPLSAVDTVTSFRPTGTLATPPAGVTPVPNVVSFVGALALVGAPGGTEPLCAATPLFACDPPTLPCAVEPGCGCSPALGGADALDGALDGSPV